MMQRKRWTEHLTISNTVFPDCLSFDGKGLIDRADGVRKEHIHDDVMDMLMICNDDAYTKFVFHQPDRQASCLRERRYRMTRSVSRIHFSTIRSASDRVLMRRTRRLSCVIYRMPTCHVPRNDPLFQYPQSTWSAVSFQFSKVRFDEE